MVHRCEVFNLLCIYLTFKKLSGVDCSRVMLNYTKKLYWARIGNSSEVFLSLHRMATAIRIYPARRYKALLPFVLNKLLQYKVHPFFQKKYFITRYNNKKRWNYYRRIEYVAATKRRRKVLGRWFRRWNHFLDIRKVVSKDIVLPTEERKSLMLVKFVGGRRHRIQRHVNFAYHNFLAYYRRQFGILKIRGAYYPNFFLHNIKSIDDSKNLWWLYKKYKKNRKWVYKKKFTIAQQHKYYKYNRFFPRLKGRSVIWGFKSRWFIRKLGKSYNLARLQNKISEIFDLKHKFRATFKPRSLSRPLNLKLDYRQKYYCLIMRKKKNNYYLSLIDGAGNIKLFISSGIFLLKYGDKRRNKKLRNSFRYFMELLRFFINKLRQRKFYVIKYFFKPVGLRPKLLRLVISTLTEGRITIINIVKTKMPRHRLKRRTKKIRRL